MSLKTTAKAAVHILFFSLLSVLSACGELSTSLFSPGGTYQVKALVNDNSLESCSIIRQDDKLIPYFAVSVVNDPDLVGLLVYLQNSNGDIVGDRVLYTINPVDEAIQPETQQEKIKDKPSIGDQDSGEEGESETVGQTEAEVKQVMKKQVSVDTKSAVKKYDTVILIKSFEQEMPSFPLPENMEIGLYSMVFEVIGTTNTLSLTESDIFYLGSAEFRLNDISMYLPGPSDTRLIPPGTIVMLEAGLNFDSRLNPYVIWYNGRNIISEGSINEGAGNILWKTPEQSGFYSLRLEVFPYRLKRNLTGIFREITLPVSAKASQTGYFFGNRPDYPAKRPLAAGTVYAEHVKLAADQKVNDDKFATALILPEYPELLRLYRFDGSLDETNLIPDRMFEPAGGKAPRWAGVGQNYGLSVGPDDTYLLRPIRFFRQEQDHGGGIFLFHIRPVAKGTVFNAFFPLLASVNDGVWMDMTMRENTVTLRLKTKAASVEIPINPGYSEEQGLIPIVVEFYIRSYRFEAKLSLGEDLSMQSMTGEIRLPGALAGEGRIKLGVDKTAPGSTAESASVSPDLAGAVTAVDSIAEDIPIETVQPESINNEKTVAAITTIWDEFAVLYSATPLLPGEIFVEETIKREAARNERIIRNPIITPTAIETRRESGASLPPAENEAPLADNQAGNILMEQESAGNEDEEATPLISLP